ncbi:hypothetical protein [Bordetella tumulicola]|uniref:hypothetical protein n=1 Tax=Bordetella tumulicola TaxID=1649133 RepID=UPI0039EDFDF7
MKPQLSCSSSRGQAVVESMLALGLLGVFMHGLVTIGDSLLRGQQAAHLSRYAAFASARGQDHIHRADMAGRSGGSVSLVTTLPQSGDINRVGNAQAATLAQDWLRADPRLRQAQATVYPSGHLAFSEHVRPASMLSVRRQTVVAVGAGHASDDATVARRTQDSVLGWSGAARRSLRAAQALRQPMLPVDAPWGRGNWTGDWLEAWHDLAPIAEKTP